jgi:hypothetical protein
MMSTPARPAALLSMFAKGVLKLTLAVVAFDRDIALEVALSKLVPELSLKSHAPVEEL